MERCFTEGASHLTGWISRLKGRIYMKDVSCQMGCDALMGFSFVGEIMKRGFVEGASHQTGWIGPVKGKNVYEGCIPLNWVRRTHGWVEN